MQNTHNRLITKMCSSVFIYFLIAPPAFALNCPTGYGETKNYNDFYRSAALLNYGVPYSPEYLIKCERIPHTTNFKCGNLHIESLGDPYTWVQPADPSLKSILFENLRSEDLGGFNLPRDFQNDREKEWCEMNEIKAGSSSSTTCYSESRDTKIYIPRMQIRKKLFVERVLRSIKECRMISF